MHTVGATTSPHGHSQEARTRGNITLSTLNGVALEITCIRISGVAYKNGIRTFSARFLAGGVVLYLTRRFKIEVCLNKSTDMVLSSRHELGSAVEP